VVYEWLSGRLPFEGSPLEIIEQHLEADPPPLRELVPDLAPAIEQAILKAMAKDPEQRYGSAEDFVMALKEASNT
jgi:serine/threonine protein kinase